MTSLAYRKATPSDLPFVVASWLDSFRTARCAGMIGMSRWRQVMEPEVLAVLARRDVNVWVAYKPGEDDHKADVYGWLAVEHDYLDSNRALVTEVPLVIYAYTKAPYRRLGIARGLFQAAGIGQRWNYALSTSVVSKLQRAGKMPGCRWENLVIRYAKS